MQIVWRTLPKLVLPAAIGLGAAYLVTSFVPRPAPSLRPPEELRAQGQAYGEESPVRTILERNVLNIESPAFYPSGQPPAPIVPPEAAAQPPETPPAPAKAAFAQADTSVIPQGPSSNSSSPLASAGPQVSVSAPISGGPRVQGLAVRPASPSQEAPGAPVAAADAPPTAKAPAPPESASRPRPAAEARVPVVRAAPRLGLEGFRLVGVIAGGERPLAMLQVDGASVSLGLGQQARGWTLVSVEPGQVLLENGAERRRLELGPAGPAAHGKAP
jgi:hypothetical protein